MDRSRKLSATLRLNSSRYNPFAWCAHRCAVTDGKGREVCGNLGAPIAWALAHCLLVRQEALDNLQIEPAPVIADEILPNPLI